MKIQVLLAGLGQKANIYSSFNWNIMLTNMLCNFFDTSLPIMQKYLLIFKCDAQHGKICAARYQILHEHIHEIS